MKQPFRMIHLFPFGLLGLGIVLGDVEKPREVERLEPAGGREKEKAGPDVEKAGADEGSPGLRNLAEEAKKNLDEINRLMEKIRGDLSSKQTGDSTQGDQRQVVKKLQDLIEKLQKSCQSSGGGESEDQDQDQKQSKSSGQKKSGSDTQRAENEKQQGAKPGSKKDQASGKKKDEAEGKGQVPNDRTEKGAMPPSKAASLDEQVEALERWGMLPKRIVEQMRASQGKDYPPEYREIISKYYQRLSELYKESNGR